MIWRISGGRLWIEVIMMDELGRAGNMRGSGCGIAQGNIQMS
jgi:hypothetical protein